MTPPSKQKTPHKPLFLAEMLIIFQSLIWMFCDGLKWSEYCYNLADVTGLMAIWIIPIFSQTTRSLIVSVRSHKQNFSIL